VTWLRDLAPRDLRALLALVASVGGTIVLTAVAVWIVYILWRGGWPIATAPQRIDKLGLALVLVLVIMGATMIGLGLAINRREVRASAFGASFEASGGDTDPVATAVAAAAQGAAAGAVSATQTPADPQP
jgi:hypothetical protein